LICTKDGSSLRPSYRFHAHFQHIGVFHGMCGLFAFHLWQRATARLQALQSSASGLMPGPDDVASDETASYLQSVIAGIRSQPLPAFSPAAHVVLGSAPAGAASARPVRGDSDATFALLRIPPAVGAGGRAGVLGSAPALGAEIEDMAALVDEAGRWIAVCLLTCVFLCV
jgi:hypothetical protein